MPSPDKASSLRGLDDVELEGRTVLVRVDFNVPLTREKGQVTLADDTRVRMSLATVNHLRAAHCRVILMSHLGRPKSADRTLSLRPVAKRLEQMMNAPVAFASDCVGREAEQAAAGLGPGEVLLLENLRFHEGETTNDREFAAALARVAGEGALFVNDAFGTAHRAHASTRGVTDHLESCAGFLVEDEVEKMSWLLHKPEHPFVLVVGGAKVSDKIPLLEHLLGAVDHVLVGGAMAHTFLRALGHDVGKSRVEEGQVENVKNLLLRAKAQEVTFELPSDLIVASSMDAEKGEVVDVEAVQKDMMGLDIGPQTTRRFIERIAKAKTILLNGPMGVFERKPFAQGTLDVIEAISKANAYTVIGGGDSGAAAAAFNLAEKMDHVSTGGGASLKFLEGKTLPALEPLYGEVAPVDSGPV